MRLQLLLLLALPFYGAINGYAQENWRSLGDVQYTDTLVYTNSGPIARPPVSIELQQNTIHKDRYRLVHPYKNMYQAYGSKPRPIMDSLYLEFRILPFDFKIADKPIRRSKFIYYSTVNTGCVTDINKDGQLDTLYFRHPLIGDTLANVDSIKKNKILELQPSGYPKRINLSPIYYFANNDSSVLELNFSKEDHCINIEFPDLDSNGNLIRRSEQPKAGMPDMMTVYFLDGSTKTYPFESKLWDKLDLSNIQCIIYGFGTGEDSAIESPYDTHSDLGNPLARIRAGERLQVYDSSGRLMTTLTYNDSAQFLQTLRSKWKGTYVVKGESVNFKIQLP